MINQSQRIIVQSMLPLYAVRYLHSSPSQIGVLFSISGLVIFIVMIPAGFLMDLSAASGARCRAQPSQR